LAAPSLSLLQLGKDNLIYTKVNHKYAIGMMTSTLIRNHFLEFFTSKEHVIVPSAPIVIKDDPTLLFTNAGMNQFKDYFLDNKKAPYVRIADTQKCLRVSGKHNDLEEVGVDTYHHTMFEMLGNWSFGDPLNPSRGYFKEEAIAWSWELLTEIYKIEKERLYVTVFEGDAKESLPKDDEAISCWKRWISEERIIPGNKKDNFWEMGDTGPCGPCTEIHVDCRSEQERKKNDGKNLVNNDHPQVIEIWNNVFIQYNRKKDGSLEPLPAKHVDTGMGFERLVRVLQNKQSNYDTDVFTGTITEIEKISHKKYDEGDSKQAIAFRVIADHIRAIAFPIADGQLPSNTGAGYVIRRILRRAVRYYFSYLDIKQPLLYKLIPLLGEQYKNVFPELYLQIDFISKVVHEEEQNFLRTLDKGLKRMDTIISTVPGSTTTNITKTGAALSSATPSIINGKDAFELYDTYGFPIDLTRLIARENDLMIDEEGFEKEMLIQKNRSRAAGVLDIEDWIVINENGGSKFVGYDSFETGSKVLKYRKTRWQGKEIYHIVLDKTPFYAESGGQVGDKGSLIFDDENIQVTDTKKENDLIIHFTKQLPSEISGKLIAKIDAGKRSRTQIHHSATHLMHAALRCVLGVHVTQKGSLVTDEYLRFDFSHFTKVTDEELLKVESLVNEKIRENIPVIIKETNKEEAIQSGAMALFGEKYGEKVRVVIIDPGYSIELCGGTHVAHTGELGIFKVKSESAIGTGVRRIEAFCGKAAEAFINEHFELVHDIREKLKNPKDIRKTIENVLIENIELRKRLEKLEIKNLSVIKNELLQKLEIINDINFIGEIVDVSNPEALKNICFSLKKDLTNYVMALAATIEGKSHVVIMLDPVIAASKNLDASHIIKELVAPVISGNGGGQKILATAGGNDATRLAEVIEKVKQLL
jgi:alanyl-tRNA synthetase